MKCTAKQHQKEASNRIGVQTPKLVFNPFCDLISVEDDAENLISSCHKGMFRCASDLHCIQTEAFCDQHLDCIDGSDEPQGCNKL